VPQDQASSLLGTSLAVYNLFDGAIEVDDSYGEGGSKLYNAVTMHEGAEINELIGAAGAPPRSVLELACGTGRITFPLLQQGYTFHGLDYSPHMLAHLTKRLEDPKHDGYAGRLSITHGDMTNFSLGRKFDVIILAASAVINVPPDQRAKMFACVRDHLTDDGRFLFTFLYFPTLETSEVPFENVLVVPFKSGDTSLMVTLTDFVDPGQRLRSASFICHTVEQGAVTSTAIYTSRTYPAPRVDLEKEITEAGLRVLSGAEMTSGYDILKAAKHPARVVLMQIGLLCGSPRMSCSSERVQ
jgi:SAM-dependent methyltransferase